VSSEWGLRLPGYQVIRLQDIKISKNQEKTNFCCAFILITICQLTAQQLTKQVQGLDGLFQRQLYIANNGVSGTVINL